MTFIVAFLISLACVMIKKHSSSNKEETPIVQNEKERRDMNYTKVRAAHILVDTEQGAKELLQDIKAGKISFEDAAKQKSKCPSSKQGGDLGYFKKGMMVKEFEDAAFSGEVNSISDPVKTQFGWHLIKIIDKK